MRHDYTLEGIAFRLRPVADKDAAFIISLRSDRGEFFQEGSNTEREQIVWQKQYYERPGDYYFIIEKKSGEPVGTIAAYDINEDKKQAEFGRWLVVESSPAAVESAWLIHRFIFETLGFSSALSFTIEENRSVVSFHNSCGAKSRGILPGKYMIKGRSCNAIVMEITDDMWRAGVSARMKFLAARLAKKIK